MMHPKPAFFLAPPVEFSAHASGHSAKRAADWKQQISTLLNHPKFLTLFPSFSDSPPPEGNIHIFHSSFWDSLFPWRTLPSKLHLFSYRQSHCTPLALSIEQTRSPLQLSLGSPFSILTTQTPTLIHQDTTLPHPSHLHKAYGSLGMCALHLGHTPHILINAKAHSLHAFLQAFAMPPYNVQGMALSFLHECAHLYQEQSVHQGIFLELSSYTAPTSLIKDALFHILYGFPSFAHAKLLSLFPFFQSIREMQADILSTLWFAYLYDLPLKDAQNLLEHVARSRSEANRYHPTSLPNQHDTYRALKQARNLITDTSFYRTPSAILHTTQVAISQTLAQLPHTHIFSTKPLENQKLHSLAQILSKGETHQIDQFFARTDLFLNQWHHKESALHLPQSSVYFLLHS